MYLVTNSFIIALGTMVLVLIILSFSLLWAHSVEEAPTTIHVNTSNGLEEILCMDSEALHNNDVILLLDTGLTHNVSADKYCSLNISQSLTITSNSTGIMAHIDCIPTCKEDPYDKYWTRGFVFYGTNGSLELRDLNITNCGTNLTGNVIGFGRAHINYTRHNAAVLAFIEIRSLIVYNVSIVGYNGFAIAAVNLPNASFSYLNISYSFNAQLLSKYGISILGSGVLVLYYDRMSSVPSHFKYSLTFFNTTFYHNYALHAGYYRYPDNSDASVPVTIAPGLSLFYTQNDVPATVSIVDTSFQHCFGYSAGALFILRLNSSVESQTVVDGSNFYNNTMLCSDCSGAAILGSFYYNKKKTSNTTHLPLVVTNSKFSHNGWRNSGAITIATSIKMYQSITSPRIHFIFRKVIFYRNNAYAAGSCIFANVYPSYTNKKNLVSFLLESVRAHDNKDIITFLLTKKDFMTVSLFHFTNFYNITINGTTVEPGIFSHNYGSVFKILHSNLLLEGHLLFDSNTADKGAAFHLIGNSYIYIKNGLKAKFINNTSQSFGGAIVGIDSLDDRCVFQPFTEANYSNINLTFIGNEAKLAGNAVYSTRLYNCSIEISNINQEDFYKEIFKNTVQGDVSSDAFTIFFCNNEKLYHAYPGGSVHIPVSVQDVIGNPTYAVMTVMPSERKNVLKKLNWQFSDFQGSFIINGKNVCTIINLTIHTMDTSTLDKTSLLLFTMLGSFNINRVEVMLHSCPLGFQLDNRLGACVCSYLFIHIKDFKEQSIICNTDNNTFTKPAGLNLWIGTDVTGKEFQIAYCNPSYCNIGSQYDLLHFNKTSSYLSSSASSETIPLCYGSRTGELCGECITNYSVVFGSTDCKHCSGQLWWLLTSMVCLTAGPLLVFLLYALKLTLTTGTLNGIIFYAQITHIVVTGYLNTPCPDCGQELFLIKVSTIFVSWLNLNLGFPLCFYNGMTELWKAGLCLLFPLYLLSIVSFLIVLSRFSTKVSNRLSRSSIQVLVTVIHLSFTKLLEAVIDVFSSSLIFVEGRQARRVWYNSGAVLYASAEHKTLMIVTSVVVGVILLPYMVLVLFGKLLLRVDKLREYVRPLYEAIHAPFKEKKWYWFALQQLFLLLVYVLETVSGGKAWSMLVLLILLIIFLYLQAFSMPFKNKLINILNLSLVLGLNIEILVTQFIFLSNGSPKYFVMFFAALNYPIIAVFCLIIAYHILISTNKMGKITAFCHELLPRVTRPPNQRHYNQSDSNDYQYREPLLETLD